MSKGRVLKLAKELGADVLECSNEIVVDAPQGFHFSSTGTHSIVSPYDRGEKTMAWRDIWGSLSSGLSQCPPGCQGDCNE